ncbi:Tail fiber protein [compost metagenome]
MARITLAGEDLIAQKQAAKQPLNVVRFVFANVPGLNPSNEVDRAAPKPPVEQIVYSYDIPPENSGYVNPSQVVYSAQIGSDVGDWDFNWIGLESTEGVLFAVAYVPLQQKRRNIPAIQVGNNLTRNFLVVFDGAQALTGITIDASTWQHDFTVRLAGIDERERLSNRDVYGRACFFGSALQLEKVASSYQLKPGTAYVEGVRIEQTSTLPVVPTGFPTTAWLDVALQRELSDVVASWQVVFAVDRPDYIDSAGGQHYCVALADLPNSTTISDRRPVEPIGGPLVNHFAARVGDYAGMRARATTKDDVGLGNLPNAKSDDPASNSSEILATTKALQGIRSEVVSSETGQVASFAMSSPPAGWLKCNGAAISRTTYAALFSRIGTTYGAGNGSTTFNLPDIRGEFLRGWDDGRGIDASRALGSAQVHQLESHSHTASSGSTGAHSHTASSASAGAHSHTASSGNAGGHSHTASSASAGAHTHTVSGTTASGGAHTHTIGRASYGGTFTDLAFPGHTQDSSFTTSSSGAHTHTVSGTAASSGAHSHTVTVAATADHAHTVTVNTAAAHTHALTVDSTADHAHTVTVNATGGTETRPRNVALLFCIRY